MSMSSACRTRPAEQPLLRGANRRDLRVAWDRTGRARRPRWSASRDSASGWWRDRSARTRPASGTRTGAADDRQPLAGRGAAGAEQGLGGAALCRSLSAGGALGATACRLGGLESRRNAAFADLSGGQQRAVRGASAGQRPDVGDPGRNDDRTGRGRPSRGVGPRHRGPDRGATVLLVTHFMDEAEGLCDRGAVLSADRGAALETWAPRPRCPRW